MTLAPAVLDRPAAPRSLQPRELADHITHGTLVIDLRDPDTFDAGHVPGALNLPATLDLAAALAPLAGGPLALVADTAGQHATADALARSRPLLGTLSGVDDWARAGLPLRTAQSLDPARAARQLAGGGVALIDVRSRADWLSDQVPGSLNVPLPLLLRRRRPLPALPLLVAGDDAGQAALAASAIRAAGHPMVWRVGDGGTAALIRCGVVPRVL